MKTRTRWIVSFLVAAVGGMIAVGASVLLQQSALTQTQPTAGSLPLPPMQPTEVTLECTRLVVKGERYFSRDHIPCNAPRIVFPPVKATAAEMMELNRRPSVVFEVAPSGQVSSASVSRSSGSKTVDEKSLKLITASPHQNHNCGACKVTAVIGVDFQGPVWMRE